MESEEQSKVYRIPLATHIGNPCFYKTQPGYQCQVRQRVEFSVANLEAIFETN